MRDSKTEAVVVDDGRPIPDDNPVRQAPVLPDHERQTHATTKAHLDAAIARGDDLERTIGTLVDHYQPHFATHHRHAVQQARVEWARFRDEQKAD